MPGGVPGTVGECTELGGKANGRFGLMSTPITVCDGHNDLPWAIRLHGGLTDLDLNGAMPSFQTDVPRLRAGGVGAQFWSVFVPGTAEWADEEGIDPFTATCEQVDLVHRMIRRAPRHFALVTTAEGLTDLASTAGEGTPIASLLGAEGGHSINNSIGALRTLYRLGVRYLTLTHNENNDWADSGTDEPRHGGLTEFGQEVVAEMNRLGMMVDLSHTAATTMADALEVSTAPVIFSHSSARTVTDNPRNVPDEILERMAAGGGICMATFVSKFINAAANEWFLEFRSEARRRGVTDAEVAAFAAEFPPCPTATIDDVVAHINHIRDVAGVDHVGLGGDHDGTTMLPQGLSDVGGYPRLVAALAEQGWSRDDLTKLGWRNIAATMGRVEAVAQG